MIFAILRAAGRHPGVITGGPLVELQDAGSELLQVRGGIRLARRADDLPAGLAILPRQLETDAAIGAGNHDDRR